ncbi:zinc finger CCHC domain-containing protein 8 isoform X3 [Rattus norvegicus]|uniref:zinc finger CCHC domain-containing protein 8 isoform X3 n=1 Tax=Rattus norvegicus TaxID=10116 RepID=UPI001916E088|nr:zinc finger CCHC domain-containing protein 8 isoform X4 [Rattus norvegicus]
MAAGVDFGDLELFEAFDPQEESTPKPVHTRFKDDEEEDDDDDENGVGDAELQEQLRRCEETIEQLRAENQELKRKLNILTRPSGILVSNTKIDGPLLQILFMNNAISKQYHQEIEEFVSNLVKRFEEQQKNDVEKTSFSLLPQPSSVMLEEDRKVEESCAIKNNKEAFSPRNAARISEKRKEYMDACGEANSQSFQQRYHAEEVEERFGRFKPGVISEELQDALGVTDKSLPPFIYRMRQLGYPPGWLKEAELETSGLALYDGNDDADGETETGEIQNKNVTYDLSKLVNYPGFNISTPRGIPDEWRMFGSIPMQACQQKDVFASYLNSNIQSPSVKSSSKRSSSQSSPNSPKKQRREGSAAASPADMELDSDIEIPPGSQSSKAFQFQPPLPPGTPPPLPQGTPPPLFTPPLPKGTPPLTPSDSPQPRPTASGVDEDALTLEELEEQQRQIWAALQQAEGANSDSDVPMDTPLTGNSVASSPCPNEFDLRVPEGRALEKPVLAEPDTASPEPSCSPAAEAAVLSQKEEGVSAEGDPGDGLLDNGGVLNISNGGNHLDTRPPTASKTHSPVPDMSKFAHGITPFEFENMAESTGMYLRIRNLLKNSPRNQQKNKKTSE